MLESMHRRIRSPVKLIDKTKRNIVYTDYCEDELSELLAPSLRGMGMGTNLGRFDQKRRMAATFAGLEARSADWSRGRNAPRKTREVGQAAVQSAHTGEFRADVAPDELTSYCLHALTPAGAWLGCVPL
jgi:hypothetical protein